MGESARTSPLLLAEFSNGKSHFDSIGNHFTYRNGVISVPFALLYWA